MSTWRKLIVFFSHNGLQLLCKNKGGIYPDTGENRCSRCAGICIGGLPEILIPDNLHSGVSKAHRHEPDINTIYQHTTLHFELAIVLIDFNCSRRDDIALIDTQIA
jgi:hypothetical protein